MIILPHCFSYNPTPGASECLKCPIGTESSTQGAISQADCAPLDPVIIIFVKINSSSIKKIDEIFYQLLIWASRNASHVACHDFRKSVLGRSKIGLLIRNVYFRGRNRRFWEFQKIPILGLFPGKKGPGFRQQSPFPEVNRNSGFIFNREVGNSLFWTMGTLGIAIIPGKNCGNLELDTPYPFSGHDPGPEDRSGAHQRCSELRRYWSNCEGLHAWGWSSDEEYRWNREK